MATGKDNDILPVRRQTKQALAEVKGSDSYDALLTELLEAVPPERLRQRIDARREERRRIVEARRAIPPGPPRRSPEKQLLIAAVAERRWRRWLDEGRVTRLGPRRYRWNTDWAPPREAGGVRVVRRPGRGLP